MMRARDNPFRSERIDALRHRPVGWTWEQFDRRLRELNSRGAIVGNEGSGKTTLLDNLAERYRADGIEVLRIALWDQHRALPPSIAYEGRVILLDGAEQLDLRTWNAFLRSTQSARGLIVTSHREGLLPTIVRCGTSEALLNELLDELLGIGGLENLRELPMELLRRHHGNIRLVMRDLYDHFAQSLNT